jgi:hypothetical protein
MLVKPMSSAEIIIMISSVLIRAIPRSLRVGMTVSKLRGIANSSF